MPSPVIRARIAPVALVVAFAFVVAGFLRADREMTHAEQGRAALMASETATLVEVFLLRQVTRLQSVEHLIEQPSRDSITTPKLLRGRRETWPPLDPHFEQLWVVIPNSGGHTVIRLTEGDSIALTDSSALTRLVQTPSSVEPRAILMRQNGRQA